MDSLRRLLKSLAGRKAGATRGGTPGSHVNKSQNKRAANKSIRRSRRIDVMKEIEYGQAKSKLAKQFAEENGFTLIDGKLEIYDEYKAATGPFKVHK